MLTRNAALAGAAAAALLAYSALGSHVPREAAFMAAIFVLAALLWVTEALLLFATALAVVGLEIVLLANPGGWTGLGFASAPSQDFRDILAAAADPVLVLFFGGLLMAQAAVKEGVDRSTSALLLRPFMSNTAASNLLLPIGISAAAVFDGAAATREVAMSIALTAASRYARWCSPARGSASPARCWWRWRSPR